MIFDSANHQRPHFVLTGDATQKWPKPFLQWRRDQRAALFGAENTMKIGAHIGHVPIQPSLWDSLQSRTRSRQSTAGLLSNSPSGRKDNRCHLRHQRHSTTNRNVQTPAQSCTLPYRSKSVGLERRKNDVADTAKRTMWVNDPLSLAPLSLN